jgi:hypothetical protein
MPANTGTWIIQDLSGPLYVVATDDSGGFGSGPPVLRLERAGDVKIYRDLYEKQRTTPVGHWKPYPYNAGNFSGNVGTWTVEAGDFLSMQYMLVGKTLVLTFILAGTSVTGSPNTLRILLPEGMTAVSYYVQQPSCWYKEAAAFVIGHTYGNGSYLNIEKDPSASPWTTTTNGTDVRGTAMIPIA